MHKMCNFIVDCITRHYLFNAHLLGRYMSKWISLFLCHESLNLSVLCVDKTINPERNKFKYFLKEHF